MIRLPFSPSFTSIRSIQYTLTLGTPTKSHATYSPLPTTITSQATKPAPPSSAEPGSTTKPSENQKPKADKNATERKPLQHDEPTSDEWSTGNLGRPAGALETKGWGETFYTAPTK